MIPKQQGIIALITVLIAGAIMLVVGIGMSTRSIVGSKESLYQELSHQALAMATSCMEQALLSLADNSLYTGNQTVVIGPNKCAIALITGSGNTRTVQTSSTVGGHIRRLSVTVSNVNPPLQVSSWQEI